MARSGRCVRCAAGDCGSGFEPIPFGDVMLIWDEKTIAGFTIIFVSDEGAVFSRPQINNIVIIDKY